MAESGWLKKSLEEAARRANDLPVWVKRLNQALDSDPAQVAPRQSGSYPGYKEGTEPDRLSGQGCQAT